MSDDKRLVRARFSRAAKTYQAGAALQREICGELMNMLECSAEPRRILEVGCGTGLLTRLLAESFSSSEIDALDLSSAMIEEAKCGLGSNERIKWIASDICEFENQNLYDLIVSSSVFHWINPIGSLFNKLACLVEDSGELYFALMVEGTLPELREVRMEVAPNKMPNARFPQVEEVEESLRIAGFEVLNKKTLPFRVNYPSAWAFLKALQALGVTSGAISQAGSFLTRGELEFVTSLYQEQYGNGDGSVRATYEVSFFRSSKVGEQLH